MRTSILVLLSLSLAFAAAAQSDQEIVDSLYPKALQEMAEADHAGGGPEPFRASCFLRVALNGPKASSLLVAGYTDGWSGVVRVIDPDSKPPVVVSEPDVPGIAGIQCDVRAIDLDSDGTPEVVVAFSGVDGDEADWVFAWRGAKLVWIGPATSAPGVQQQTTALCNATFADVNGDGRMDAESAAVGELANGAPGPNPVYLFGPDGRFGDTPAENFTFMRRFFRKKQPGDEKAEFDANPGPYRIRILTDAKGEYAGSEPVTSGRVVLNGEEIMSPNDFKKNKTEYVFDPVPLLETNKLVVTVTSNPDSSLLVLVEPHSEEK